MGLKSVQREGSIFYLSICENLCYLKYTYDVKTKFIFYLFSLATLPSILIKHQHSGLLTMERTKCIISHPFLASVPSPKAQPARCRRYRVQVLEAGKSVAGFPVHMESISEIKPIKLSILNLNNTNRGLKHWSYYSVTPLSFYFLSNFNLGNSTLELHAFF